MDAVEYLLNFIERLEEGLEEVPLDRKSVQSGSKQFSDASTEDSDAMNQSYFENTEIIEEEPLKPKEANEYLNTIAENFFGQ